MARWKKRNRTNSAENIQRLRNQIDIALCDHTSTTQQIRLLKKYLNRAYREEEQYWKQKSRNPWLRIGYRNTRFFHGSTKARKSRNFMKEIHENHGNIHR